MSNKIFDVLKESNTRFLLFHDSYKLKEKISSSFFVGKAFSIASNREGLTGKTCKQNVEVGDFFWCYNIYVSSIHLDIKVSLERIRRIRVELICIHSPKPRLFKAEVYPSNASKKRCTFHCCCHICIIAARRYFCNMPNLL